MKSCNTITKGVSCFDKLQWFKFFAVVIFLVIGGNVYAASFCADLVETKKGRTQTSRFFLLDDQYRLDVVDEGRNLTILVNRKSGKTKILIPDEKEYLEIKNSSFRSAMNNPIEAYNLIRKDYESRTSGMETIAGIKCEKMIFSDGGKDIMTAWVAKSYGLPIRIVNPENSDRAELKNIKEVRIDKAKFQVPAGYTEQEDPARKRDREEAALSLLTSTATGKAPWTRRIGPSGEMRVAVDKEKSVRIEFENITNDESVFTIKGFRAGQPITLVCRQTSFSLKGKWRRDECLVGNHNQADEISIIVEKGKILAHVFARESSFSHEDKTESFFILTGIKGLKKAVRINPKRKLRLSITSDSQDGTESGIKVAFYKDEDHKDKVDETDVVLKNGQNKIWDYPVENGIKSVSIEVAKGGGAQVILEQPVQVKKDASAKKQTIKKASKQKYKPKVVDKFTVAHPSGTSRPLTPGKNLAIIVTGISANASGTIDLYTDRKKSKKIDTFIFKLKKKQTETHFIPGSKQVGWTTVWVHKGSFKVKLDQSPGAKAALKTPKKKPIKPSPSGKGKAAPSGTGNQTTADSTIFNGAVPLMPGAKVLKKTIMGASGRVDLEIQATPEEVVNFYKKTMTAKGWQAGMAMNNGAMGVLQLAKGKSQIMLKAKGNGQKSIVNLALVSR